jgi:hypothetical protein
MVTLSKLARPLCALAQLLAEPVCGLVVKTDHRLVISGRVHNGQQDPARSALVLI